MKRVMHIDTRVYNKSKLGSALVVPRGYLRMPLESKKVPRECLGNVGNS